MNYVIDRFEGNIAICNSILTGENIELSKYLLPKGVKEGDVIIEEDNKFSVDKKLTEERHNNITERMNKLFRKNNF